MSDPAAGTPIVGTILDEYLRRLEAGEAPPREELIAAHPECAAELAAALDGLEFVHRAARQLPRRSEQEAELEARQQLGDYRLVREIGRGGMAVVYEAEQLSLGRRVALKVLPFAAVLDPKQLQRFKNEALAAAHLRHPHIVPVYAVGSERGVHFYAMQLIEGQSLAAVIREIREAEQKPAPAKSAGTKSPISSHASHREPRYLKTVAALAVQAAEALDHAHQLGVVHRDIKPGNLLVDATGELWITDFGLAHTVRDGDLTLTGELLGTFRYMSPEQTLAKRVPMDHRTDVYSLGATLYELLTLEHAFPGDDPHVVMRDIVERDPVPPRRLNPALPVDFETIILKAMAKDPSSRYATAQEMAEDLERFLRDQPILARRPSLGARAAKWARRHRGFVTAAAVVLLLAVVALAADHFRVDAEQKRTSNALAKANDNLLLARSVAEKFLVEIGVTNMLDQPVPGPQRQRLLEAALKFYEREFDDRDSMGTRVTILHALHRYGDAVALIDQLRAREPAYAWAPMQRGHMLWHQKQFDEALKSLEEAIALDDGLAEAHAFHGCVLKEMGEPGKALPDLDRAIALSDRDAALHNYRGNALADLGRNDEALAEYERASGLDPNLPQPLCGKGEVLTALGRLHDALAAYDKAISVDPGYAWAYTGRGMTLQSLGRLPEALEAHDRAIALDPSVARAQTNRGIVLAELGRVDDAVAAHREAIRLDGTLAQAHRNLAAALIRAGRLDDAEQEVREALNDLPSDAPSHFNLGCIFTTRKSWDAAIDQYREAIRLDPKLELALVNWAGALYAKGDLQGSIEKDLEAIAINGDSANAWGGLGNARRDLGDVPGAIEAYTEVVRLKPDYPIAHFCLGRELAKAGRHVDACVQFAEASRLDGKFAEAHRELGNSRLALHDPAGAAAEFEAALRIRPEDADLHRSIGKAYGANGCLEQEIREYEEAVRIRKDYAEAWTELGRARQDRGDVDGAILACSEALKLRPDLPEAHLNIGNSLSDKNDLDSAISHFHEAIRLITKRAGAELSTSPGLDAHNALILSLAYNSLGCTLDQKRDLAGALAAFRDAVHADPTVPEAHYGLAKALYLLRDHDEESEAEYRAALQLDHEFADALIGLGRLFMVQNRNREALPCLRQGQEIGSKRRNWKSHAPEWIALVEKKLVVEDRLDEVLAGKESPHDEGERAEFALLLYYRKQYRKSEEFYATVLANDPKLADDLDGALRYNAACSAVLAAANGAPDPAVLRRRALERLQADLAARVSAGKVATLDGWKKDPDFKSVRDDVSALPEGEREGWTKLWTDVDAQLAAGR